MESRESVDLDFSQYLLTLKRRWVPFTSIFLSTVALSALSTVFLRPSYEAEGRLLFKNSSFKVVGSSLVPSNSEGEGGGGELKPLVATQNPISTQIEVLSSRPLLEKTIEQLKLKNSKDEPLSIDTLQGLLSFKIIGGTDVLKVSYKSPNPKEAATVVNKIMRLYLENDILTSRAEAEDTRKFIAKQMPKTQAAVNEAEVALRKFKEKNNVVDLTEEAKSAVGVMGNLENAINTAQSQLDEANAQSNELRQKLNLNAQEAMTVSAISQSPAVQGSLTQLQEIERQLATERTRFSDDNPLIVSLKDKQTNLTNLLQQQLRETTGTQTQVPQGLLRIGELKQNLIKEFLQSEVQRSGLSKRLSSLQNSRSTYEQRVNVMPQLAQTQRQLERQFEVSQSTYQNLLKKFQELQVAKNKSTSTARIIADATIPDKPGASAKPMILILGVLAGALLATTAVICLEMRDKSLKTIKDIRQIFGYTLLGVIPSSTNKTITRDRTPVATTLEVAVRDTPQSLTSEMSRMIQSNLRFLGSDRTLKTIVVTSSVANEGKSKVATNLAASIAQVGQKVLLIDADMRVPYQHNFWKLPLKKGLSEVLMGKVKFPIVSWKVMDNLDILTAGSKPSNPLACLDSKRMKALIEEVSELYDFVIIDSPPLLVAADAVALGRISDGILLVSRPGLIDAPSALAAQEKLEMSKCNILGLIVNGVIEKNEAKDYFSYAQEYFTDEEETEVPWTDYMTLLGQTIANQSRQETALKTELTNFTGVETKKESTLGKEEQRLPFNLL